MRAFRRSDLNKSHEIKKFPQYNDVQLDTLILFPWLLERVTETSKRMITKKNKKIEEIEGVVIKVHSLQS
jgi:hypothetical protein